MKGIEEFEKLVGDIEKSIPTLEYIKEQANINVTSIKKYFPRAYRAKRITISGAYIIFTISKDTMTSKDTYYRYISSSKDVLSQINLYKTENTLAAYIYETDYIDARRLESWLKRELMLETDTNYNITLNKIEDIVQKNILPKNIDIENIIPKDINVLRCIDNISIYDIVYIPHVPGAYILQFTDGECYVGSSLDLRIRIARHRSRLSNFISNVSICETKNVIDASILEVIFIKILEPKYNRTHRLDNGYRQSINIPCNGKRYRHRLFREKNEKFIAISKDISELLEEKMMELFNKGIFSVSTQKLAEYAIKKGLDVISDNMPNVSDKEGYQYRYQYQFQYQYQQYQQFEYQYI